MRPRSRARALLGLPAIGMCLALAMVGCGGGGGGGAVVPPPGGTKAWTFMVYMNASNDLQTDAAPNIDDMQQVGSTKDVNIVVQWTQTQCGVPSRCGSPDWNGTRRYYVNKGGSTLLQDMGANVDPGDWHTLHDFIGWAEASYPATHMVLVVWDHGSGWRNIFRGAQARSLSHRAVSFDYVRQTEIETWELPQALSVNQKLDMIVFDASLLQQLEVAYEIRNSAPLIVASEESPPGRGYIYNTFLADLAANPGMTPRQFGSAIVHRTINDYAQYDNNPGDLAILTQSMIDASRLQNLADKVSAFGAKLTAHIADSSAAEASARNNALHYAVNEDAGYWDYKDLFDYCDKLKAAGVPADLAQAATDVQNAISFPNPAGAVIDEAHTSPENGSHGITIDVMEPAVARQTGSATYANLAFGRTTTWFAWQKAQAQ